MKTLTSINMPLMGERIVVMEFSDRVTDATPTHKLYIEIMGRRSNIMLVGEDGNVAVCGYQVRQTTSTSTSNNTTIVYLCFT